MFLFSAALNIGAVAEAAGKDILVIRKLAKWKAISDDKESLIKNGCDNYPGEGANPYKYPIFSMQGGLQLSKLIDQINKKLDAIGSDNGIKNPVFAAHSVSDTEANIDGIVKLFHKVDGNRVFYILSKPNIEHASLVLRNDIELIPFDTVSGCMEGKEAKKPLKNPHFSTMMDGVIEFFDGFVIEKLAHKII